MNADTVDSPETSGVSGSEHAAVVIFPTKQHQSELGLLAL